MPPKYPVEISPVREVTLVGTADLSFWTDRLRTEKLRPADHDGQAQLYISAVASRFKGIPFREVSISICTYPDSIDTTAGGHLPRPRLQLRAVLRLVRTDVLRRRLTTTPRSPSIRVRRPHSK